MDGHTTNNMTYDPWIFRIKDLILLTSLLKIPGLFMDFNYHQDFTIIWLSWTSWLFMDFMTFMGFTIIWEANCLHFYCSMQLSNAICCQCSIDFLLVLFVLTRYISKWKESHGPISILFSIPLFVLAFQFNTWNFKRL